MTITREQVEAHLAVLADSQAEDMRWNMVENAQLSGESGALLRDLWQRVEAAEATLIDIARMGKKAGSESAKHRLRELGIDWETGEASPDYGSMT